MTRLVGDVRGKTRSTAESQEFMDRLKSLMLEYGVDRIQVGWSRPEPCARCGEGAECVESPKDIEGNPNIQYTETHDGQAPGETDQESIASSTQPLASGVDRAEALGLLDNVVGKMSENQEPPDIAIDMDQPYGMVSNPAPQPSIAETIKAAQPLIDQADVVLHHSSCPSYGREDEADVICNCDA